MNPHQLIYGAGDQVIRTTPTRRTGEPMLVTSATATIVDLLYPSGSSEHVVTASAAATLDTTTGTTTANAGPSSGQRKRLTIANATSYVVGRPYALVGLDGQVQEVVVEHTETGFVHLRDDLRAAYASGSTLRGFQLSFTFPSATADSESAFLAHDGGVESFPYAIDWVFAASPDPDPPRARELIYVRRHAEPTLARPTDVELLDSSAASLSRNLGTVERSLQQAHRDFFREIRARKVEPDRYIFGNTGRDAVVRRACEILRRAINTDQSQDLADQYRKEYYGILSGMGGSQDVHLNRGSDVSQTDVAERLRWRRP